MDYENSRAKFNKAKEILTVTIPVLPQPGPVSIASDEWVVDVSDENVVTVSLLTKDGIEIWEKFSLVGQTTVSLYTYPLYFLSTASGNAMWAVII